MHATHIAALAALGLASSMALASPAPATPTAASYLSKDVDANPALAASFATLTAPVARKADWIEQYGTASPSVAVELDGRPYLVYTGCKPHDCPAETYAVLYDTEAAQMVAGAYVVNTYQDGINVASTIDWLGRPDLDKITLLAQHLY